MTSQSTTALPSRRARREAERAAEAAVEVSRVRTRRAQRVAPIAPVTRRVGPRAAALATLGGLAVGVPAAGLAASAVTPAFAADTAVPAASQSVLQTLNEASATAELEGSTRAEALTLDEAGQTRARIVAATNSLPADVCAAPTAANGVVAAIAPASEERPVVIPIEEGAFRISSPFGHRTHPIFGVGRMHNGVDYAAPAGTPIHAVAAGTVIHSGPNIGQPGTLVVIEHELNGVVWTSWYLHMYSEDIAVAKGQQVAAGDLVGLVGSAGNSTGPHLHLEIHEGPGTGGAAVDPQQWLATQGADGAVAAC